MKKYSSEWKYKQQEINGGWPQKDDDGGKWRWHYVRCDTEYYDKHNYRTQRECIQYECKYA